VVVEVQSASEDGEEEEEEEEEEEGDDDDDDDQAAEAEEEFASDGHEAVCTSCLIPEGDVYCCSTCTHVWHRACVGETEEDRQRRKYDWDQFKCPDCLYYEAEGYLYEDDPDVEMFFQVNDEIRKIYDLHANAGSETKKFQVLGQIKQNDKDEIFAAKRELSKKALTVANPRFEDERKEMIAKGLELPNDNENMEKDIQFVYMLNASREAIEEQGKEMQGLLDALEKLNAQVKDEMTDEQRKDHEKRLALNAGRRELTQKRLTYARAQFAYAEAKLEERDAREKISRFKIGLRLRKIVLEDDDTELVAMQSDYDEAMADSKAKEAMLANTPNPDKPISKASAPAEPEAAKQQKKRVLLTQVEQKKEDINPKFS
jgi:hypothetical protein